MTAEIQNKMHEKCIEMEHYCHGCVYNCCCKYSFTEESVPKAEQADLTAE